MTGSRLLFVKSRAGVPVDSSHPAKWWIASFDRGSAAEPTDREWQMLRSYIEYVCLAGYYREGYGQRILNRGDGKPPWDSGHNTVVFHKRADDDWGYRRSTFDRGPAWTPCPALGYGTAKDLPALLDFINNDVMANPAGGPPYWDAPPRGDWVEWKNAHPEVFA